MPIGLVWILTNAHRSHTAQALGIGVTAVYLWTLLSMALTAVGNTLLSFRLYPVLLVLSATAGVFRLPRPLATDRPRAWNAKTALITAWLDGSHCVHTVHPWRVGARGRHAYTNTMATEYASTPATGTGEYYPEIDKAITSRRPGARRDTVVLTTQAEFLSIYPYYGFQALTSHYANPLAQYDQRAAGYYTTVV